MERCRFPETSMAIAYETQGLFELAQESYEKVRMCKHVLSLNLSLSLSLSLTLSPSLSLSLTLSLPLSLSLSLSLSPSLSLFLSLSLSLCIQMLSVNKKCMLIITNLSSFFQAIKRARELHNMSAAPPSVLPEYKLWEEHWCRCSHELGQWEMLNDFGKSQNGAKPFLGMCIM